MKCIFLSLVLVFCFFLAACNRRFSAGEAYYGQLTYTEFSADSGRFISSSMMSDIKFWYEDSCMIQELTKVNIQTSYKHGKELTVVTKPVYGYKFIDLRRQRFYNFSSFSDTASIIKQGQISDSVYMDEGWSFWIDRDLIPIKPPLRLSDTTLNGFLHQRLMITSIFNDTLVQVAYFRCDKKGMPFQLFPAFSKRFGCPMVRTDDLTTGRNALALSGEIKFFSKELTPSERKVFAAWKKNAKENPMDK